jgi:predicted ATPase
LLAISGQKTAALAQYDQFHRMLAHEIGTEPTIETQALVEQINSGDSLRSDSFDAPPLPLPPTRIVGRNTEIQVVTTYLRGENTRALTLTGPPGIGKTRLALEVATQMQFDFEQGTRYIELAPIADANLVPLAIAQAFEIKERAGKTLASILIAALKNHHCLLVLDNFEHVLEAASFIAEVLAACPLVKILITSRSPLGIRAEQQLPLAPLTLPGQINPLAVVTESPAVQLFVERAQAVRPDFAFTAENAADIAEICARLDGLPLAIELIAVRAKTLSPAELLEQLELGLDAFAPNLRDLTERHQTLSNAIAWSYNLLKADEQRVFIYLGVFSGGCTLQAAQEVLSETGLVSSILTSLEALHHASLVQTQNHAGETRFTLLETLRIFALEQLISQGEAEAFHAHQQHSDYFLRLALKAEPELIGPNQKNWFDRLERELANLRAAFKWNLEHLVESSLRLATVLEQFWAVRGYFEEGRHWLKTALRQDAQISISIRAEALTAAGNLAWRQGDYKEAQILLIESRQLFTQAEDANGLARAIYGLGMVAVRQAGYAQAETFFQESLNLARNLQDLYTEACSLNGFGQVKLRQGNRALARTYTEQALALHQARKDPRNTAGLTLNLGVIAYEEGEYEPARNYTETSLKIAHELNDRQIMTVALLNQGNILIAQGSLNAARISLEEAIAIHRVQNDREPMAPALGTLGRVLQKLGDLDAARACQHEALTLRTEADDRRGIAVSLQNLAVLEQSENQAKRAAQLLGAADAIRKAIGSPLNLTAQVEYDQLVVKIQDTLGKAAFESAWGIGRTLSLEQAIELAFDSPSGR